MWASGKKRNCEKIRCSPSSLSHSARYLIDFHSQLVYALARPSEDANRLLLLIFFFFFLIIFSCVPSTGLSGFTEFHWRWPSHRNVTNASPFYSLSLSRHLASFKQPQGLFTAHFFCSYSRGHILPPADPASPLFKLLFFKHVFRVHSPQQHPCITLSFSLSTVSAVKYIGNHRVTSQPCVEWCLVCFLHFATWFLLSLSLSLSPSLGISAIPVHPLD